MDTWASDYNMLAENQVEINKFEIVSLVKRFITSIYKKKIKRTFLL